MNINEIMIGDCVSLGDLVVKVEYGMFIPGHLTEAYKPIPLTAEILEKNGFGEENILGDRSSVPQLLQVFDDNYIVMYQKYFRYVHELQHALRLCGLNEKADNFKI